MSKFEFTRRGLLKSGAAVGAGLAMPTILTNSAHA
ncbi:MAG: twin-arginine translocation signal domain-containing protein, partial [Pseudomonadota bacterium]